MPIIQIVGAFIAVAVLGAVVTSTFTTIDQAHVAVVTMFGKYRRVLNPGLNVLIPFVERIHSRVPVQNQTAQLKFSAITNDQAAVHFISTIIFSVSDHSAETVQKVAFKFIDTRSFNVAMTSAVEASVREFVATKRQAEVLGLRGEIVSHAKSTLDEQLASWGFTLDDLTVNDITFDAEVMQSMSRVVAAKNAQTAAEFEGQALLISRTKQAEADGAAIKIAADSEAEAARLRGVGLANFRKEIALGLSQSAETLAAHGISDGLLAFTMWTETVRDAAKEGRGNVIFLDGSVDAMQSSVRQLQGMMQLSGADDEGNDADSDQPRIPTPRPDALTV